MTHTITWTHTLLDWSCFRLVWLTAAAHSERAPLNGDVSSESDERSHERQSMLPSHPVVVFVVDWTAQSLWDIWSLSHKLSLEVFILSYQGLFLTLPATWNRMPAPLCLGQEDLWGGSIETTDSSDHRLIYSHRISNCAICSPLVL